MNDEKGKVFVRTGFSALACDLSRDVSVNFSILAYCSLIENVMKCFPKIMVP